MTVAVPALARRPAPARVVVAAPARALAEALAGSLVGAGHVVTGVATTTAEAVSLCRDARPDVLLVEASLAGAQVSGVALGGAQVRVVGGERCGRSLDDVLADVAVLAPAGHGAVESDLDRLTPREQAVLGLLCAGSDVVRTARALGISPNTCRSYVRAILTKLDVQSQSQAVALAYRRGFVRPAGREDTGPVVA